MDDIAMMREALALAQAAADDGEVPVGCVIMRGGEIVGRLSLIHISEPTRH